MLRVVRWRDSIGVDGTQRCPLTPSLAAVSPSLIVVSPSLSLCLE